MGDLDMDLDFDRPVDIERVARLPLEYDPSLPLRRGRDRDTDRPLRSIALRGVTDREREREEYEDPVYDE